MRSIHATQIGIAALPPDVIFSTPAPTAPERCRMAVVAPVRAASLSPSAEFAKIIRTQRIVRAIIRAHEWLDGLPEDLGVRGNYHRENARRSLDAASECVHRGRLLNAIRSVRDAQFSAGWTCWEIWGG